MTITTTAADSPWLVDGADVVRWQGTDAVSGLTSAEAARRLSRFGPNRLESATERPVWRQFLSHFTDPLMYLLFAAIAASIAAWAVDGASGAPFEAIVIAAIVVANGVLGFVQERKAEEAVAALQRMVATTVVVVRDGTETRVPAESVVPGDIALLREGDVVAADGRVLEATSLTVSEASLTGESEPVLKDPAPLQGSVTFADRRNLVFSGTAVTRGSGRVVVTATGMHTEMGRLASLLHRIGEDRTPLQREIDLVGRMLGIAAVAIAFVVVVTIVLTSEVTAVGEVVEVLVLGVSLAVAAVPEGLPTILTLVLAIGVRRMALRRAIVKQLSSVETLGSTSVICSDKTGTLTKNEMTIQRVVTRSGVVEVTGIGYEPEGGLIVDGGSLQRGPLLEEVRVVLCGGALANDAVLRNDDGRWTVRGDPTDGAFLVAARKLGVTDSCAGRFSRVAAIPFSSERKLMSVVASDADRGGASRS